MWLFGVQGHVRDLSRAVGAHMKNPGSEQADPGANTSGWTPRLRGGQLRGRGLEHEAEKKDKDEAEDGNKRGDKRPRLERLADGHPEILLD